MSSAEELLASESPPSPAPRGSRLQTWRKLSSPTVASSRPFSSIASACAVSRALAAREEPENGAPLPRGHAARVGLELGDLAEVRREVVDADVAARERGDAGRVLEELEPGPSKLQVCTSIGTRRFEMVRRPSTREDDSSKNEPKSL